MQRIDRRTNGKNFPFFIFPSRKVNAQTSERGREGAEIGGGAASLKRRKAREGGKIEATMHFGIRELQVDRVEWRRAAREGGA